MLSYGRSSEQYATSYRKTPFFILQKVFELFLFYPIIRKRRVTTVTKCKN